VAGENVSINEMAKGGEENQRQAAASAGSEIKKTEKMAEKRESAKKQ
jgi:hypothetical protein